MGDRPSDHDGSGRMTGAGKIGRGLTAEARKGSLRLTHIPHSVRH